ncbi:MAG: triose-phosphate isomerase [Nanoarchaeota archaeon]|nr:triose-phosphate isomerase [Nanoarchaeota archaeon]MBU1027598.1 triose-phosphate isomerase [Nanoarchaeota archaeon]
MKPIVIINFKTYKSGKDTLKLAKVIEKFDKKIIIGVQATDLHSIYSLTNLPIFIQHVDFVESGKNTGFITPEAVYDVGARGVFLNHSEHKLKYRVIKKTVKRCKKIGLKVAVFAGSLKEAKKLRRLKPDYLIYEPPELVGGKISVSKAKPEIIGKIAEKLKYPFLVGAGVKTSEDIKIAMKLGAKGIAVSSAITKAKNPKKVLKKLLG